MEYINFKDEKIPLIGFGTWTIGDNKASAKNEIDTMLYGINKYSMTLIDTAEMYGDGKSESVVKEVIKDSNRESLFIVDKILPVNAKNGNYLLSCKRSLKRLGIDYLDLYLLHWKADVDLQDMVNNMELLVKKGLIKHWGVSNFDVEEMEALFKCKNGRNCFCNQVLYNVGTRGPEFDLIPWCNKNNVLFMAYSPLFNETIKREYITRNAEFKEIAKKENMSPESLMINFVIRDGNIVTIFKTSNINHLENNLLNVFKTISEESLCKINEIFPSPNKITKLKKI